MLLDGAYPLPATRGQVAVSPVALVVAACIALGALTLLFPSSPTYDPWAWIIWGRETIHGTLSTTDGPSWKPLPMLFTTPFALFGDAAPQLWLVVARAGGFAAVAMGFVVARRLGGSVVAGVAAAGGLILAPWLVRNCALGNSEGMMVAVVLAGVERHLAGRTRHALACGVLAALLRPEAWPFLGLYGLWMLWRERREALLPLAAGAVTVPLVWLVPEKLGSGDWWRASDRAQHPLKGSPAYGDSPLLKIFEDAGKMLTWPVIAALVLGVALVAARRVPRAKALALGGLLALAVLWTLEVAIMTARGFSGNQRYLITPVSLAIVAAAVPLGWLVTSVARERLARLGGAGVALAAVAAGAAFLVPSVRSFSDGLPELRYEGRAPHRLADVVSDAGGAPALRRCGTAYTGQFQVTEVAWRLDERITDVGFQPRWPAVVLRTHTKRDSPPVPAYDALKGHPVRTLAVGSGWRVLGACR